MQAAGAFADQLAAQFSAALRAMGQAGESPLPIRLLGPAECPIFRLKGYYRFHFQLQSPNSGALHQLLRAVLPALRQPTGVEFTVDIDPQNML
jgi:primosomal protein N' (replication factor Y)